MSGKLEDHAERRPRIRVNETRTASFFPGEVARLLGLKNIDYDQLRRMWKISMRSRGEALPEHKWARFTLRDLAALEVILGLVGPRDRLIEGRHLNFRGVESACDALRALGFDDPLLQVPMIRDRSRIIALVGDYVVVPTTGQLALDYAKDFVDEFLTTRVITDREVRAAIRDERRRSQPKRNRMPVPGGLGIAAQLEAREFPTLRSSAG